MKKNKEDQITSLAIIGKDIEYIKISMTEIKNQLEADYVRKGEFDPVKKIVYGLVALLLTGVVSAMLVLVFRR